MEMEEAVVGKEWILEIWWGGVGSAVDSYFCYGGRNDGWTLLLILGLERFLRV